MGYVAHIKLPVFKLLLLICLLSAGVACKKNKIISTYAMSTAESGKNIIGIEFDQPKDGEYGLGVTLKLTIDNLRYQNCKVKLEVFYANGQPVKDLDGKNEERGVVVFNKEVVPPDNDYEQSQFDFFIPYAQLHLEQDVKHDLKLIASINYEGKKLDESQKAFTLQLIEY